MKSYYGVIKLLREVEDFNEIIDTDEYFKLVDEEVMEGKEYSDYWEGEEAPELNSYCYKLYNWVWTRIRVSSSVSKEEQPNTFLFLEQARSLFHIHIDDDKEPTVEECLFAFWLLVKANEMLNKYFAARKEND